MTVAVLRDRNALNVLHDEIGSTLRRRTGLEDFRDVGVIHQSQRLPLRLEAGHDTRGIHTGFDDLEGDLAANGLALLGEPHFTHPAAANALEEAVGADALSGL